MKHIQQNGILLVAVLLSSCLDSGGSSNKTIYSTPAFIEDRIAPSVLNVSPGNGSQNAGINAKIIVNLSEPVAPSSVAASAIIVSGVSGTLEYSGTTLTFTPSGPLAYSTSYTVRVKAGLQDFASNVMAQDFIWSFTTAAHDLTPPSVMNVSPLNGTTNVDRNSIIQVGFSEPLAPSSLTNAQFTLMDGTVPVSGNVSVSGQFATFTPDAPLNYGTLYTATLAAGIQDLAGNPMGTNYSWTLTTLAQDLTPPTVLSTGPANGTIDIDRFTSISVLFSEPMDPATITATEFTLTDGVSLVPGTVSTGFYPTFTPTGPLNYGTRYTAMIGTGVKDLAGNAMTANHSWSFTTVAQDLTPPTVIITTPQNATAFQDVNTPLRVYFSEDIDPATVNNVTFVLMNGATPVSGYIHPGYNSADFQPTVPLQLNSTYTVTLTTGIKDRAGNPLATNYSWSFTTEALFMPPTSIATGFMHEAVAIGDVNNDGRNDVVATARLFSDTFILFVLLQNTSGGLDAPLRYATGSNCFAPDSVAIGDVNHDGRNDVVVGFAGCSIEIFTQNAAGTLNAGVTRTTVDARKVRIADMNNDGRQDIVGMGSSTVSIWMQNTVGMFDIPATYAVNGNYGDLNIGDINNDGLNDVIMGSYFSNLLAVLLQTSGSTLATPAYYTVGNGIWGQIHGVAVGDVNGDLLNDVAIAYGGNSPNSWIGVFTQNAGGTLDPEVSYASYDIPSPIEIADVTGDNRKDILVGHDGWRTLGTYMQRADGSLQNEIRTPCPCFGNWNFSGLAIGDLNGDGKNDAIATGSGLGLQVLYHY